MLAPDLFMTDLIPATLDRILYKDLRPWEKPELTEEHYRKRLGLLGEETTDFPFRFNFKFPRPFSQKTRYYNRLIRNQVILEVPRIIALIEEKKDDGLFHSRLSFILVQCLEPRLIKVGKLIKNFGFTPDLLDYTSPDFHRFRELAANAYVIRELGRAYAKIYLEVQEAFSESIAAKHEPEDLYALFIDEPTEEAPILRLSQPQAMNGKGKSGKEKSREDQVSTDSFRYLYYGRYEAKLEDAWDCLVKNGLIARETPRTDFLRVFSGKVVDTPVKWLGFTCDLYYFILLLHTRKKLVRNLKKKVWEVTCKCFVRDDGSSFDHNEFPNSHLPKVNKACIESVVDLLI
jgi:hypothetical protein